MKNLWIFSKATDEQRHQFLLCVAEKDDAIVLIQDGTYLLLHEDFNPGCLVYALRPDLIARGIKTNNRGITYADLVDLIFQYQRTITI